MIHRPRRCPLRKPRVWLWALVVALPAHMALAWVLTLQNQGSLIACPVTMPMQVNLVRESVASENKALSKPVASLPSPKVAVAKPMPPKMKPKAVLEATPRLIEAKSAPSAASDTHLAALAPAAGGVIKASAPLGVMQVQDLGFASPPKPAPYPAFSRRRGEEGTALVMAYLTRQGTPEKVKLEQTSGYKGLDEAALGAASAWRFNAPPSAVWVRIPVAFRLEN